MRAVPPTQRMLLDIFRRRRHPQDQLADRGEERVEDGLVERRLGCFVVDVDGGACRLSWFGVVSSGNSSSICSRRLGGCGWSGGGIG